MLTRRPLATSPPRRRHRRPAAAPPLLRTPAAGLLLHGQTEEQLAERAADRKESEELAARLRPEAEALAAKYRAAAASATALAEGLLEEAPPGEEGVPEWLTRRFRELGIK